jgi:hypothetical protein
VAEEGSLRKKPQGEKESFKKVLSSEMDPVEIRHIR